MSKHVVLASTGMRCPRCGQPTQVRQHASTPRHAYYRRWYYCANRRCRTNTIVMPQDWAEPTAASSSEVPW